MVKRNRKGRIGVLMKHKRKQYSTIKKKIDIIAWKNRKHFSKKKITRNLAQLLHRSTSINRIKLIRRK
jgi:hypothetical protein